MLKTSFFTGNTLGGLDNTSAKGHISKQRVRSYTIIFGKIAYAFGMPGHFHFHPPLKRLLAVAEP